MQYLGYLIVLFFVCTRTIILICMLCQWYICVNFFVKVRYFACPGFLVAIVKHCPARKHTVITLFHFNNLKITVLTIQTKKDETVVKWTSVNT